MSKRLNISSLAGYVTWIVGLAIFVVLTASAVDVKQMNRVRSLDIRIHSVEGGKDMMQAGDVYRLLKSELGYPLVNLPLEELDLARVENVVRSHPYIRSAEVYLDAGYVLHVQVRQKTPVLRVIPGEGASYYLDERAAPMPLSGAFTARVPVVMGAVPGADESRWSEEEWGRMNEINHIRALLDSEEFYRSWIDQIIVHPGGEYSLYSAMTDQYVDLGSGTEYKEQLEKVKTFCKNVIPVKGWKKYARIDARYEQQVVGKRRH